MAQGKAPQTIIQAMEWGWEWLSIECQVCKRCAEMRLGELPTKYEPMKIADVASMFRCSPFGHKSVSIALGRNEKSGDSSFQQMLKIQFEGSLTVSARRE